MKVLGLLSCLLSLSVCVDALFVVNEPSMIVYETPEDNGHIEDIIRYGAEVEIAEEQAPWVFITYPGWHGWVLKGNLLDVKVDPNVAANAVVGFRGGYVFRTNDTEWGPFLSLPFETPIRVIEEPLDAHRRWVIVELQDGQRGYMQRSQLVFSKANLSTSEMIAFSQLFFGTKYLWGGTTSFGYDCSGFVQMLYRQMGIILPRNSNQQAVDPRFKDVQGKDAQPGDLVFFINASGKVVHVGMMVNETEFIHAYTKEESWICLSSLADDRFRNGYVFYGTFLRRYPQDR